MAIGRDVLDIAPPIHGQQNYLRPQKILFLTFVKKKLYKTTNTILKS